MCQLRAIAGENGGQNGARNFRKGRNLFSRNRDMTPRILQGTYSYMREHHLMHLNCYRAETNIKMKVARIAIQGKCLADPHLMVVLGLQNS